MNALATSDFLENRLQKEMGNFPSSVVWAVDPNEAEDLASQFSELNLLSVYLGRNLRHLYPVFVSSRQNLVHLTRLESLKKKIGPLLPRADIQTQVRACSSPSQHSKVQDLLEFTKQVGAQLVLVSSHGRSGLSRVALGSFAEALLKESPIPLWFIPRNHINHSNPFRALYATDFTKNSIQGYFEFLQLVKDRAKELILYHAILHPIEGISACGAAGVPGYYPDRVMKAQFNWAKEQAQLWIDRAKQVGVPIHLHSIIHEVCPSSGKAILEAAFRHKVSLIGVASQKTQWSRPFFGSVARDLFRAQTHSVWVCGVNFYSR
jgi:Universal stress protein family